MTDLAATVEGIGALAEPVRRALYDFVVASRGPVGREEAAEAVGVPVHTAKFHLDRLAGDGLLDVGSAAHPRSHRPGAGRPTKLYRQLDPGVRGLLPPPALRPRGPHPRRCGRASRCRCAPGRCAASGRRAGGIPGGRNRAHGRGSVAPGAHRVGLRASGGGGGAAPGQLPVPLDGGGAHGAGVRGQSRFRSGTFKKDYLGRLPEGCRFYHPLPRDRNFPTIPFFLDDLPLKWLG